MCVYSFFLAAQNMFSLLLAANVLSSQSLSSGFRLWALDKVLALVPNEVGDAGWMTGIVVGFVIKWSQHSYLALHDTNPNSWLLLIYEKSQA